VIVTALHSGSLMHPLTIDVLDIVQILLTHALCIVN